MTFLDTGILVGALLEKHPEHAQCRSALEQFEDRVTDAHALAETFSTLTGFYKVPPQAASELTLSLQDHVRVEGLLLADYATALGEAPNRGVMGGGIYDSLHATFARRRKAVRVVTRNPSHFAHVAPDLEILTP
ncbi:MAG TPA: PIN domain-containing protein [Terriglobales bacterium]|nr:PIN domain-containing protein [Terriglobales bacterium]